MAGFGPGGGIHLDTGTLSGVAHQFGGLGGHGMHLDPGTIGGLRFATPRQQFARERQSARMKLAHALARQHFQQADQGLQLLGHRGFDQQYGQFNQGIGHR